MSSRSEPLTIAVYVRPAQLLEPIDAKIDTLGQLESAGTIDSLSLHAWPEKITLSEGTPYTDTVESFREMEAWADEHDVSIQPPFDVRTTTSSFTGETRTMLRTPMMCLAVYVDSRLSNVFPHSRGQERYSVTDAIAAIRTGELELFSFAPEPGQRPPDQCSDCDTLLTNVQGIGVCQHCDRVELGRPTDRRTEGLWSSPDRIAQRDV